MYELVFRFSTLTLFTALMWQSYFTLVYSYSIPAAINTNALATKDPNSEAHKTQKSHMGKHSLLRGSAIAHAPTDRGTSSRTSKGPLMNMHKPTYAQTHAHMNIQVSANIHDQIHVRANTHSFK